MAHETLFTNVRLIDGLSDRPREGASILVRGERFASVGDGPIPLPEGAREIDLGGKTIVPGLIDTHVHATFFDRAYLPLFLAAGVTSARDVGGNLEQVLELRAALASGAVLGPRLLAYGPMLDGAIPSTDLPFFKVISEQVPSPDSVPEKIGRLLDAGVDGIKIYFTMMPETTRAVLRFVDRRVPVTGHLGYTHSIDAIEAGIDGLEHVWISPYNDFCALEMRYGPGALMSGDWFRATARGWAEADLENPRARAWYDAMVEKQVALGTTLVAMSWGTWFGKRSVLTDPDRRFVTPQAISTPDQSPSAEGSSADEGWDPTTKLYDSYEEPMPACLRQLQKVTRTLHERGGVIVGGTDCGAVPYPPPGFSLLREVEMLSESIGALQAIRAVTSAAARHLRREEDLGAVAAGRYADFLVIDGDPLKDPRELRKLVTVYRGGEAHDPKGLLSRVPQRSL